MGSQNFRAVAARAMIVSRVLGVNPSHPTGCSWRVTYPCMHMSDHLGFQRISIVSLQVITFILSKTCNNL